MKILLFKIQTYDYLGVAKVNSEGKIYTTVESLTDDYSSIFHCSSSKIHKDNVIKIWEVDKSDKGKLKKILETIEELIRYSNDFREAEREKYKELKDMIAKKIMESEK
jgi:hypothetical protein